jgi:hypothetical protein
VLDTGRADAKKYIVFVTDGNPTLRMTQPSGDVTTEEVIYVHYKYKDYLLTDPYWGGDWLTDPPSMHYIPTDDNKHYYVTGADGTKHIIYEIEDNGNYLFYPVDPVTHEVQDPIEMTASEWSDGLNAGSGVFGTGTDPVDSDVAIGWTREPSTSDPNVHGTALTDAYGYNYDRALLEANSGSEGTTFFAVSTSTDASRLEEFTNHVTTGTTNYYDGTDPNNLNNIFSEIASEITTKVSRSYTNVTISDTLSEWAEFSDLGMVDGNVQITYKKDGVEYTPSTAATVDTTTNTVTWNITDADGDTVLDEGVTYSMTFKVWPNQAAFDRAADIANGKDTADSGTSWNWDTDSADTTSGIYSNDFSDTDVTDANGSTTTETTNVTWSEITTTTVNGVAQDPVTTGPWYDGYEHPTMNPPTSTIQVTKVWSDSVDSSHRPDSISFTLYQDEIDDDHVVKDASGNPVKLTLTSADVDPNDSTGNTWTGTFTIAVPAGPTGHAYAVKEDTTGITYYYNQAYDYSVVSSPAYSYETNISQVVTSGDTETGVALIGRQAQAGGATVTNDLCAASLQVVKKGATAGSSTDWNLPGAEFKLSKATIGSDGKITVGDQVGDKLTSDGNGTISFGPILTANSDYFLEETDAPDGYLTADPYVIRVEWVEAEQNYAPVLYKVTKQSDGTYALGDEIDVLSKIDNDRMQRTMTVTDYTIPPLPYTGGPGNLPLILGGTFLLGLSVKLRRGQIVQGRGG